jgi:hypothetical protein
MGPQLRLGADGRPMIDVAAAFRNQPGRTPLIAAAPAPAAGPAPAPAPAPEAPKPAGWDGRQMWQVGSAGAPGWDGRQMEQVSGLSMMPLPTLTDAVGGPRRWPWILAAVVAVGGAGMLLLRRRRRR